MIELTEKEIKAKKRVCLALDVSTVNEAISLAEDISDFVDVFKIGKELHISAGNEGRDIINNLLTNKLNYNMEKQEWNKILMKDKKLFLDLKLHDTPQTVYGASKACAVPGVYMFNLHIAGGEKMCKKAIEGAQAGANLYSIERPKVIGVTVLTSLSDEDLIAQNLGIGYDDLVMRRTELAREWGLDGIVCPANKAGELEKRFGSDFLYVTPGIEWGGKKGEGQKQLYTPDLAVKDCKNSILVIGSAITKAEDKKATAYEILQSIAKEL